MTELNTIGRHFMWSKGFRPQHTMTKLDRALGNTLWNITCWLQIHPTLLFGNSSDHASLLMEFFEVKKGSKPFKYYNSWLRQELFNNVFKKLGRLR